MSDVLGDDAKRQDWVRSCWRPTITSVQTGRMVLNDRTPMRDGRFDERVVLVREATTTVSAGFFDDLLAALDAPAKPNAALQRAAKRARDVVERV